MRYRWLALLIAASGLSLPLAAQDEAPAEAAAPQAEAPPAEAPPADAAGTESQADAAEAPPADAAEDEPQGAAEARRALTEDEDVFTASEGVPDEEVNFPVNF